MDFLKTWGFFEFLSSAVVKKSGSQWCIFSKDGEKLECYPTKKEATDRLRQIEFFKTQNQKDKKYKK